MNILLKLNAVNIFFLLFLVNDVISCKNRDQNEVEPTKEWWETAQFYQIYPRSFKDSDGDGIGDLKGITQNLQYLKDIGITAAWLSPIFKSPMLDFGYDISDFYSIQPEYGTMEDFENLIKKAKEIGVKIILDFVPNHSSNESEWFIKSINGDPEYKDFYVWEDGIDDPNNSGKKIPPSNWRSAFRGSAWQWNELRNQFYLHNFGVMQPDLNYRNPKVIERMNHVLRFWLNKGVDGFRIDAIANIYEVPRNPDGTYKDEPKSGLTDDPEEFDYLEHIYTQNQPETIGLIYQWRNMIENYQRIHHTESKVMMLEVYTKPEYTMLLYGNSTTEGGHLPFNFNLIFQLDKNFNGEDLRKAIDNWLLYMPKGRTANWVLGNHDRLRIGTRYGIEKIDFMNMLIMILPGVSVTYQGEEIGMRDGIISWKDTVDPAGCNSSPESYTKFSRDPCRTPFQWNNQQNSGFSTASKPWLPMAPNYETFNVESELNAEKSYLKVYKDLSKLRRTKTLQFGSYKYFPISGNQMFMVYRSYKNSVILLVAHFGPSDLIAVDLDVYLSDLPDLYVNVTSINSEKKVGSVVNHSLNMNKYEAVVLTTKDVL